MADDNLPANPPSTEAPGANAPGPAIPTDELLPPVEPPSGRFILQLFVVPAIIVACVVGLWLLFNSLARRDQLAPADIVSRLRSQNPSRFQVANDLADMLRMPERYPDVKPNAELAAALGELLDEMVEVGDNGDSSVSMRTLLCGFLGEFTVDDGVPALINALKNDPEPVVQRKAVNAIAVLAQTFGEGKATTTKVVDGQSQTVEAGEPQVLESDGLAAALIAAANQPDDDLLRSETAFTLGVLAAVPGADSRYTDELLKLLDDFYPDARYNAANGLARTGNVAAVDTIVEMLDLEAIEGSVAAVQPFNDKQSAASVAAARAAKRDSILKNAIVSARSLHEQHQGTDFPKLESALAQLIEQAPQQAERTVTIEVAQGEQEVAMPRVAPTLVAAAEKVLAELRGASE
ncbi:MAG: hypothetical protein CMJ58_26570 [Planctomycetaceae bacterium]|nr:hypothetical protein [Planctomycetaceae bacterium]